MIDIEEILRIQRIVVVDVEGNGQQPPDLVEVGLLELTDVNVNFDSIRTWLVRPEKPITRLVSKIHGITNKMVETSPSWSETEGEISSVLTGAWIVAHNAVVDYTVLSKHLAEWAPLGVIDTLRYSRAVCPGLKSYSLDALITHFSLNYSDSTSKRHRASFDVLVTAGLFMSLVNVRPLNSWEELCHLACPPGLPGDPNPKQVKIW